MTNIVEERPASAEAVPQPVKKPYQTPVLAVYGKVDQLTRVFVISKP